MAINLEALRKKHEELLKKTSNNSQDFLENFMQINEGDNIIRILPGPSENEQFYAETAVHRIPISQKGDQTKNFHCPKVIGDPSPICEVYYGLWKTGRSEDEALARKIKPRSRYYLNVFDRTNESVKILSIGTIIFQKLINTILDEDYGDITDPKTGHDFKIVKYIEGEWPKYDQSAPRPKPSPLAKTDNAIAGIMEGLHDIYSLVKYEDNETLKAVAGNISIQGFHSSGQNLAAVVDNSGSTPEKSEPENEEVTEENFLKQLRTKGV